MANSYNELNDNLFARLESGGGYPDTFDNETLNPFVNFNGHKPTQNLFGSLVAEMTQQRGVRMVYIRRTMDKIDLVFGEDPLSRFTEHFPCSVYVESAEGWEGNQDQYNSFGYYVNDDIHMIVNPDLFARQGDGEQPREGDLLYLPMANSLFELKWVEREQPWYPGGALPQRKMRATKFIYSGEEINLRRDDRSNIDNFADLFTIDTQGNTEIDRINAVTELWDTEIVDGEQGKQMEQVREEILPVKERETKLPPPGEVVNTPIKGNNVDPLDDFEL
ncbi:head closure Hc2 [Vibrio phage EniLVp02]